MQTELQKLVSDLFRYEPETGALYYHKPPKKRDEYIRAGTINKQGWRNIKFNGRNYSAGWIVWLYHKGSFPKEEIDHINMQRWDDRIENLREATRSQNCMNRVKGVNKYGFRGVKRNHKRFSASLVKDQTSYYLGIFDTPEDAAVAYDIAAKKHFGEFALLNFPNTIKRDWLYVATQ